MAPSIRDPLGKDPWDLYKPTYTSSAASPSPEMVVVKSGESLSTGILPEIPAAMDALKALRARQINYDLLMMVIDGINNATSRRVEISIPHEIMGKDQEALVVALKNRGYLSAAFLVRKDDVSVTFLMAAIV